MKAVLIATSTGNSTTSFVQRPLNTILYQKNPDGTNGTGVSLTANQFTLAAGKYRIRGWCKASGAATDTVGVELYDVTAGTAVINSGVTIADSIQVAILNENVLMHFACYLEPAASNIYELRGKGSATATNGFGISVGLSGVTDVYAEIEILKTA